MTPRATFEPLVCAMRTVTRPRAGVMLLGAILMSAPVNAALLSLERAATILFTLIAISAIYFAAEIFRRRFRGPRFTFWRVLPSAIVLGSMSAFAFVGWVNIEASVHPLSSLMAFVLFTTFLGFVFSLFLGLGPYFATSRQRAINLDDLT